MKTTDTQREGRWCGHFGLPFVIETWSRGTFATRVVVVRVEGNYWGPKDRSKEGSLLR